MNEQNILEKSFLALIEFLMLSKRTVIEIGTTYNLTAMQSMTLLLLNEPRPMHSFTKIFNCDASNVTGIIDGLEQKQLASRIDSNQDRRVKMVQINPKGKKIRAKLINELTGDDSFIIKNLSESDLSKFVELLQKITKTTK